MTLAETSRFAKTAAIVLVPLLLGGCNAKPQTSPSDLTAGTVTLHIPGMSDKLGLY